MDTGENKLKRRIATCSAAALVLMGMVAMSGCQQQSADNANTANTAQVDNGNAAANDASTGADGTASSSTIKESNAAASLDFSVSDDATATFKFTDSDVQADGKDGSYELDESHVKIVEAGTYVISGKSANGRVSVAKELSGQVNLVLEDLELSSSDGAPISVGKSNKALIKAVGSVKLTNAEDISDDLSSKEKETATEEEQEKDSSFDGAVLKVKNSSIVGITGDGSITMDASKVKNGIKCEGESALVIGADASDKVSLDISAAKAGVKAEGTVDVLGGTVSVKATKGDGIHSDTLLTVGTDGGAESPKLSVDAGSEGLEGASVAIKSGDISVVAKDDGINAANSDLKDWEYNLSISGGKLLVDSGGDGLDSNGNIDVTAGNSIILGSPNGGNCAIDAGDGAYWNQNGGTIAGVGMSSMAEAPSNGVYVRFGDGMFMGRGQEGGSQSSSSILIAAKDKVEIQSESGETVLSFEATKAADSIIFSTDGIKEGDSYKLVINGSEAAKASAETGTGEPGMSFGGGKGGPGGERPERPDGNGNFPTPPEGFNGNFENMTPPEGFDKNMTPPEGFDGKEPPEGFNGNFEGRRPPEGFDGNFEGKEPPEGFDGKFPPRGGDSGNGESGDDSNEEKA